jgi:hypothetical protein
MEVGMSYTRLWFLLTSSCGFSGPSVIHQRRCCFAVVLLPTSPHLPPAPAPPVSISIAIPKSEKGSSPDTTHTAGVRPYREQMSGSYATFSNTAASARLFNAFFVSTAAEVHGWHGWHEGGRDVHAVVAFSCLVYPPPQPSYQCRLNAGLPHVFYLIPSYDEREGVCGD